jgi:hypothetical protein
VNKPKAQGTRLESGIVTIARMWGLVARRLAEGGSGDEGDVEMFADDGTRWVLECKARAALNLHDAYCKAAAKAPGERVALVWKRLVRKGDNVRRTAAGPVLVAIPLEDYLDLLGGRRELDQGDAA